MNAISEEDNVRSGEDIKEEPKSLLERAREKEEYAEETEQAQLVHQLRHKEAKTTISEEDRREVEYLLDVIEDAEHTKDYYRGTDLSVWWKARENYEEAEEEISHATERLFDIAEKYGVSYNELLEKRRLKI